MKRNIAGFLSSIVVLLALGGCTGNGQPEAVTSGVAGTISQTPGNPINTNWMEESAARQALNAMYREKYAATEDFAQVIPGGNVYYISSINGNNTNSGKSESAAWKTCSKLSSASLRSGDTVLFECGSAFREQVQMVSGVTYSSYGSGVKPIFYASVNASGASKWEEVSGRTGLYRFIGTTISARHNDVGNICFDNGAAWGIKIQKLKESDRTLELANVSNGLETFKKIPSYAFSTGKDLGAYDLCYFHDESGYIYLYSKSGNPGSRFRSIELSQPTRIFYGSDVSNVTVCNLDFRCSGSFAIRTQVCRDLTVRNCSFFFIGGSIQYDYNDSWRTYKTRFGNAVENWGGCDGMTVENCWFCQIYDAAITTQSNSEVEMKGVVYRNNVIENVWFGVELWAGNGAGGCQFTDMEISGNYVTHIGEGMTTQRPDKIENGAGVEAFIKISRGAYTVTNSRVTGNVIDGSVGRMVSCIQPLTDANENGFLFDRNTYVSPLGATFLTIPSVFPECTHEYGASTSNKKFDYQVIQKLIAHGFEPNGTFLFAVEEGDPNGQGALQKFSLRTESSPSCVYTAADGTVIPFRLYLPEDFAEGEYPLVTYLNIESASGTDNTKQTSVSALFPARVAASEKAVLLVPQCPAGTWTGLPVSNGNYAIGEREESATMKAVAALIGEIAAKYRTTASYAVGAEAGGYAVADLLARHKDLLSGGVIISGAGDPSANVGNAKVRIFHAENDNLIPVSDASALADAWGAEATFYGWGYTHDCWDDVYRSEALLDWILGHD